MSDIHETGSKPSEGFRVVQFYVYFRMYKTYELANKVLHCTVAQIITTLSGMCCLYGALYIGQEQSTVKYSYLCYQFCVQFQCESFMLYMLCTISA